MANHIIKGSDGLAVTNAARRYVDTYCPADQQAYGLEMFDGRVDTVDESLQMLGRIMEALDTVGFMGTEKVIWVKEPVFLHDKHPAAKNDDVKAAVQRLSERVSQGPLDGVHLIISGEKISGRSPLWSAAKKVGSTEEHNEPKPWEAEKSARQRLQDRLKQEGLKADADALDRFVEKVCPDSRIQESEIEKILLYARTAGTLTEDDIQVLTAQTRDTEIWDYMDALCALNANRALELLSDYEDQKEPALKLVYYIENSLQLLLALRVALDRDWVRLSSGRRPAPQWSEDPDCDAFCSALPADPRKASAFRVGKCIQQARGMSLKLLTFWLTQVVETHERLVSSQTPDFLLLQLMTLRMLSVISGRKRKAS